MFFNKPFRRFLHVLFVVIVFCFLTCLFLWPAPVAIFQGKVIGFGTDDLTLPYFNWVLQSSLSRAPLNFLNGAMYWPDTGAPAGVTLWIAYIERIIGIIVL